ncbi:hypothetical protein LguiA_002892 [Lonicera macranthoides]
MQTVLLFPLLSMLKLSKIVRLKVHYCYFQKEAPGLPEFQTSSSSFGGTSIGVLGLNQSSSPLVATPVLGAFGGFGSFSKQSNPFASNLQSPSAFGNSLLDFTIPFGSTGSRFGVSSSSVSISTTSALGASSPTTFMASSTPTFGASNAGPSAETEREPTFNVDYTQEENHIGDGVGWDCTKYFTSNQCYDDLWRIHQMCTRKERSTTRAQENLRFYESRSLSASDILLGSLLRPPTAAILYRTLVDLY